MGREELSSNIDGNKSMKEMTEGKDAFYNY